MTESASKVAKVHEKITRCREDFLHKLSRNKEKHEVQTNLEISPAQSLLAEAMLGL